MCARPGGRAHTCCLAACPPSPRARRATRAVPTSARKRPRRSPLWETSAARTAKRGCRPASRRHARGARLADVGLPRSELLLLAGRANRPFAGEMASHLGQPLCAVTLRRFADGELFVKIDENVRGRDVFIIQPTNPPAENLMELLLLIDAARRASAARITAVLPYFGYARQDRKDQPRVAISAKLVANLITHSGADRLPEIPFHSPQSHGFL